jgi:hypothetical protein
MPIEVAIAVLVGLLAVATVLAAYVGILGLVRAITLARCENCGHLELRRGNLDARCTRTVRHQTVSSALHLLHLPHIAAHR